MHHDFSPKPALHRAAAAARARGPGSPPVVRELDHARHRRRRDVRELVLDRADGTALVVLWRTASVWDRRAKRELAVDARHGARAIPAVRGVTVTDPVTGAGPSAPAITDDTVDVALGADPLVLTVTGGHRLGVVPDSDTPFDGLRRAGHGWARAARPSATARSRTSPACA